MGNTLPGTIPGLLRRGSPVFWRDEERPYAVTRPPFQRADGAVWVVACPCAGVPLGVTDDPSNFALDLSDPTGLVHAAWWFNSIAAMPEMGAMTKDEFDTLVSLCSRAQRGTFRTEEQVETFRRLILIAANLKESP